MLGTDNTAGPYYIPFSLTTNANANKLYIDNVTGPLSYDPSTSTLNCTNLTGTIKTVNFWNTIMPRGSNFIAGGEAPVRGTTISKWFLDIIAEADKIREALVTSLPYVGAILKQNWELSIGKMPTVLGKSMMNNQPYINIPITTPALSTYHPPPLPTTQYQH